MKEDKKTNESKKPNYVEGAMQPDKIPTIKELEKELRKQEDEKLKKAFKDKK